MSTSPQNGHVLSTGCKSVQSAKSQTATSFSYLDKGNDNHAHKPLGSDFTVTVRGGQLPWGHAGHKLVGSGNWPVESFAAFLEFTTLGFPKTELECSTDCSKDR